MGTITLPNNPGLIQNGQVTDATKVMEDLTAIVNECNGSLDADNLAALAVETAKIANLAVTAAKLATDAVETLKIKDANVTLAKMAPESVDSDQYVDGSIDAAHLAADAVETAKIKDLNVTTGKLAADAVTNAKIADDAVQAENVSGLTGTGAVDADNIPDGTTNEMLTTGVQTIAGNKTFSGTITDKNGNEVLAMQMETKNNTTGASLAANTEVDVDVVGFSWTPTAILACNVSVGLTADDLFYTSSFPGAILVAAANGAINIVSLTPGANKVTVRLRNNHGTNALYYDNIIVTAVRAP